MKNENKKYTKAEILEMIKDSSWEREQADYYMKQRVREAKELQQSMETLKEVQQRERDSFTEAVEDLTKIIDQQ